MTGTRADMRSCRPLLLAVVLASFAVGCGGADATDPVPLPPSGGTPPVTPPITPPVPSVRAATGLVFVDNWGRHGQIVIADSNGANARKLSVPVNVNGVDWSPDGSQLVFDGGAGDSVRLYLIRPDGSGFQRLTSDAHPERHPAWSPDGRYIVYERSVLGGAPDVYLRRVADGETTRLTTFEQTAGVYAPTWSGDGRRIAFTTVTASAQYTLHVMDADGRNLRTVASPPGWRVTMPALSPDGRRLVASATDATNILRSRLFLFDLEAGTVRQFLDTPATVSHELAPAWSPDGAWIAFASLRDAGGFRVFRVRPDGAELTPLSAGSWDGWPRWRR